MSRPRRDPEAVRVEQFRRAVMHSQIDAGLTQNKELAEAAGMPPSTLWKRMQQPDTMTIGELKKLVGVVPIDPGAVLALVGYLPKEILRVVNNSA